MPNPKRRHSNARTNKRRAHDYIDLKASGRGGWPSLCPHCGERKAPHRVCPHCGQYRGREIIEIEEE